ncbi:MAG TPA: 30S ribosomal protein S6 [Rhizomicrobium sp.]|nr:30S ribosomal protein S6 [Rhizomicrobium sp.]
MLPLAGLGAMGYTPPLKWRLRSREARFDGSMPDGPASCAIQGAFGQSQASVFRSPNKGRQRMALYEHLLIARQDISAQAVDALATHLKTIVEGEGGKVEKQEYWGLRSLAYRIKKNRKGHYVLLNINAPSNAVNELERQLKINEDVLRYITVKVDKFEQSASKNKREREDRADNKSGDGNDNRSDSDSDKEAAQ